MKDLKELFIPYELALIAKEKGFDDFCFGKFFINENKLQCNIGGDTCLFLSDQYTVAAPLYQQLLDWLFKKGIGIYECFYHPTKKERIYTVKVHTLNQTHGDFTLNEAIEEAFKLI